MSRQSRVPRESIFAAGGRGPEIYKADAQATCSASLFDCVHELEDINAETHDAQLLLRAGTSDLKRMSRVLSNQRVSCFLYL